MPTLCRSYTDENEAHRGVERVLGAGVPAVDVRVLMGTPERDVREEPHGTFAEGAGTPESAVGSFAGSATSQQTGMSDFASKGEGGRRGGFGDADRDTITIGPGTEVERVRIVSHGSLKRLLTDAGLDEATADQDVAALHSGRILVLVETTEMDADALASALDGGG
jgi:hypothetical protein